MTEHTYAATVYRPVMEDPAYDFWLFDLDGTLVDAEWPYIRRVFDRVGERLDRRFDDREAAIIWHGLGGVRDRVLRSWDVDPATFWAAFHEIEDPAERARASTLHADAAALLSALERRSVPIGVVTHCQRFLTEPVLEEVGLEGRFETVVCCHDDLGWKPDPAPVHRAVADLGVGHGGRGVLVGDGESDVGAAWNAGLEAAHVERHRPADRGCCVRADYRLDSLEPLVSALGGDAPPAASD